MINTPPRRHASQHPFACAVLLSLGLVACGGGAASDAPTCDEAWDLPYTDAPCLLLYEDDGAGFVFQADGAVMADDGTLYGRAFHPSDTTICEYVACEPATIDVDRYCSFAFETMGAGRDVASGVATDHCLPTPEGTTIEGNNLVGIYFAGHCELRDSEWVLLPCFLP